jgi:hypothetical protein
MVPSPTVVLVLVVVSVTSAAIAAEEYRARINMSLFMISSLFICFVGNPVWTTRADESESWQVIAHALAEIT